jgi:hypothetical protein
MRVGMKHFYDTGCVSGKMIGEIQLMIHVMRKNVLRAATGGKLRKWGKLPHTWKIRHIKIFTNPISSNRHTSVYISTTSHLFWTRTCREVVVLFPFHVQMNKFTRNAMTLFVASSSYHSSLKWTHIRLKTNTLALNIKVRKLNKRQISSNLDLLIAANDFIPNHLYI